MALGSCFCCNLYQNLLPFNPGNHKLADSLLEAFFERNGSLASTFYAFTLGFDPIPASPAP